MSPYFRISYAIDLGSLRKGCKLIQEFCGDLWV
jgi:aspartate aminotransferase